MATTKKWSVIKAERSGRQTWFVRAERHDRFWSLRVKGRDDLFAQATSLEHAESMVRDLIASTDGVPSDAFDVRIEPKLDDQVDEAVAALDHLRVVDALGGAVRRAVAVVLVRGEGISMRDAARILGLSHQRIDQLIREHDDLGGDKRPNLSLHLEELDQWSDRRPTVMWRAGEEAPNGH